MTVLNFYDEELDIDGTAENLLNELRYLNKDEDIPKVERIICCLKADRMMPESIVTENDIKKAAYMLETLIERKSYPDAEFYIGSMKKDIIDGYVNFEDFYLNDNIDLSVSMQYEKSDYNEINPKNDQIIISVNDYRERDTENKYRQNTFALSVRKFMEMDHKQFDDMLNEAFFYADEHIYDTDREQEDQDAIQDMDDNRPMDDGYDPLDLGDEREDGDIEEERE